MKQYDEISASYKHFSLTSDDLDEAADPHSVHNNAKSKNILSLGLLHIFLIVTNVFFLVVLLNKIPPSTDHWRLPS